MNTSNTKYMVLGNCLKKLKQFSSLLDKPTIKNFKITYVTKKCIQTFPESQRDHFRQP